MRFTCPVCRAHHTFSEHWRLADHRDARLKVPADRVFKCACGKSQWVLMARAPRITVRIILPVRVVGLTPREVEKGSSRERIVEEGVRTLERIGAFEPEAMDTPFIEEVLRR